MRFRKTKDSQKHKHVTDHRSTHEHEQVPVRQPQVTPGLQDRIEETVKLLGGSTDLGIRTFRLGPAGDLLIGVLFLDGLVDQARVQDVQETLSLQAEKESFAKQAIKEQAVIEWAQNAITVGDVKRATDLQAAAQSLVSGETVILFDGCQELLSVTTSAPEHRAVSEPVTQTVIRGPQEAFTETLRVNTSLVRRKIKDPNLWMETKQIGKVTKTDVAIMYINGLVKESVLQELHARMDRIQIDGILESGYIEELIREQRYAVFPTVNNTERPDVVAAALLEGRVAVFIDGTPFVLLMPTVFIQFFQAAEDYYHLSDFGVLRLLRLTSFFLALLAPSLYIAITTFHQEMLPTSLLISLAAQREGIPFPAFAEALMMEITFELLREAGIRMPRAVGTAISIVGALVLGQAAVQAGLVSPAMVIIVSITAINSFVFPNYAISIATRVLRFPLMLLAATFGIFGIIVGMLALLFHLTSIRSFGVPYLTPFSPFVWGDQKDALVRWPRDVRVGQKGGKAE